MNIVITGSSGFIAKNLIATLKPLDKYQLFLVNRETSKEELFSALLKADFLFHFAGSTRPDNESEFEINNVQLTFSILDFLKTNNKRISILFTSSIHVQGSTDYGKTKLRAEALIKEFSNSTGNSVFIYRLSNVFGKWSKPNYSSVIATYCYNASRGLPLIVHDINRVVQFIYIDDVTNSFVGIIRSSSKGINYIDLDKKFEISLGTLAKKIQYFESARLHNVVPKLRNEFDVGLLSTYTSFLSVDALRNDLHKNKTSSSSFTELIKSEIFGQISLNTIDVDAVKGNHWHHTKHEKFLVIQGEGIIRLRSLFSNDISKLQVSGEHLEWIEIPPGMVHNIENVGNVPLITIMWSSEMFDPNRPDTYPEAV